MIKAKEDRLELLGHIYNGRGDVEYLKNKFGEKIYERSITFLIDEEFVVPEGQKNYYVNSPMTVRMRGTKFILVWELTTNGVKYYEKEMENQEKIGMTTNVISAENSNVAINSNKASQNIQKDKESTMQDNKKSNFISKIAGHPIILTIIGGLIVAFLVYKFGWN